MLLGRWFLKNTSVPAGAYAIQPLTLVSAAADSMLSAASRKKAVLRAAASPLVSGGTRRVLVLPGFDALAITASAQTRKRQSGSSTRHSPRSLARRRIVNLSPFRGTCSWSKCGAVARQALRVQIYLVRSGNVAGYVGASHFLYGLRLCRSGSLGALRARAENKPAKAAAHPQQDRGASQMPRQDHNAGVSEMRKLQPEIGNGRDGQRRHGQGQSRMRRQSPAQHGHDGDRREDADDGGHGQTVPVRSYREPLSAKPDPVLHASMAHAAEPQCQRR